MEERKNKLLRRAAIHAACVAFATCLLVNALDRAGVAPIKIVALLCLVCVLTFAAVWLSMKWRRRINRDRRIIAQAKAAGVWYNMKALGGRALELRVWEDCKIRRKKGETDAQLRRRYSETIRMQGRWDK